MEDNPWIKWGARAVLLLGLFIGGIIIAIVQYKDPEGAALGREDRLQTKIDRVETRQFIFEEHFNKKLDRIEGKVDQLIDRGK